MDSFHNYDLQFRLNFPGTVICHKEVQGFCEGLTEVWLTLCGETDGRSGGFAEEAMSESELNPEAINRRESGVEKLPSRRSSLCRRSPESEGSITYLSNRRWRPRTRKWALRPLREEGA